MFKLIQLKSALIELRALKLKVNLPIQNYCLKLNDTWHGTTETYLEFISEIKFIGIRASRRAISSAIEEGYIENESKCRF